MTSTKRGLTSELLRVCAMLFVVILHGREYVPLANDLPRLLYRLSFLPAWAGVWIFLFLSGYGVASGFFAGRFSFADQTGKLRGDLFLRFYLGRFVKLAPLYYLYCVLFELLSGQQFFWKDPLMILKMAFFLFNGTGGISGIGHLWYISMAMQLYLIMPFLLLFANWLRRRRVLLAVSFALLLAAGMAARVLCYMRNVDWYSCVYANCLMNVDLVLGGILIAAIRLEWPQPVRFRTAAKIFTAALFTALVLYNCRIYSIPKDSNTFIYRYILPSAYLAACGLLLLFAEGAGDRTLTKGGRLIGWLSGRTYCFYVFHVAVFNYLKYAVVKTAWFYSISPLAQYLLFFSLAIPLIILVSVPMQWFSQSVVARYRSRKTTAVPTGAAQLGERNPFGQ